MKNIDALVRSRRSVRTFDERALSQNDLDKLCAFMKQIDNPYGLPVAFRLLDAKTQNLSCPVVVGTDLYVGAKMKKAPHFNEAFGYSFEMLVLYAQSLGVGTVWVGGTMDRAAFENAMELAEDEVMPCVSPLGYPAQKMSLRETMMRKGVKADERMAFGELFFDGAFDAALTQERAGKLFHALEMVRLAPSAVNKQPWRIVMTENAAHFYLKRSKGFGSGTLDMQKIDVGIAMCHFDLAAREAGLSLRFVQADPGIASKDGEEYIASYEYGTNEGGSMMKRILVAYFSASGVTRAAAQALAAAAGADLFEIKPETPYTAADLDWTNKQSRSTLEMQDVNCRPALAADDVKMEGYEAVFLGFPIWWGREPSVIDSFMEAHDFAGKRVIPFCTSGGGGFANRAQIEKLLPGIEAYKELSRNTTEADLSAWLKELSL